LENYNTQIDPQNSPKAHCHDISNDAQGGLKNINIGFSPPSQFDLTKTRVENTLKFQPNDYSNRYSYRYRAKGLMHFHLVKVKVVSILFVMPATAYCLCTVMMDCTFDGDFIVILIAMLLIQYNSSQKLL
jgi:hypothetical protein